MFSLTCTAYNRFYPHDKSCLEKPQDNTPAIVPYQGDIYTEVEKTGVFDKGVETAAEAQYGRHRRAGKVSVLGYVQVVEIFWLIL